jgi:hypothetical protein
VRRFPNFFFEKVRLAPVLSAILISSWWRSGFLCCWRVVAHAERRSRAHPGGGNPRRADRQILITQERATHPSKLGKYQRSWSAFSRSEQSSLQTTRRKSELSSACGLVGLPVVGAYNRTLKGKPEVFPNFASRSLRSSSSQSSLKSGVKRNGDWGFGIRFISNYSLIVAKMSSSNSEPPFRQEDLAARSQCSRNPGEESQLDYAKGAAKISRLVQESPILPRK